MTHCQRVFEAIQKSKGQTDFAKNQAGRYKNQAIQSRWAYFQLGWEMREATA